MGSGNPPSSTDPPTLTFKQTKTALHRQVWLQREAQTARSRSPAAVFHVGGEARGEHAPVKAPVKAMTGRPRLRSSRPNPNPPAKSRPATSLGHGRTKRVALRRPRTAPEPTGDLAPTKSGRHMYVPTDRKETSEELPSGKPPAPTADRRPFSPRAPRGFFDSRAHGQIWIDRRSQSSRSRDRAEEAAAGGHRWCGSAEARWKAARSDMPTVDPMASARSAAAAGAVVELLGSPRQMPGESQAAALRMEGFRPRQHGRVTRGHPLHTDSAPYDRTMGRRVVPWKSGRSLSGSARKQGEKQLSKKPPKQRVSLYAHVPDSTGGSSRVHSPMGAAGSAEDVVGWGGMLTPPPTPPPMLLHTTKLSFTPAQQPDDD